MKVINLFGGPGCGKSTLAAELFVNYKKAGYNVELVTEYAKELVYEQRHNVLDDQLYILAKQNRRLRRLSEAGVEFAITDSPLILAAFYNQFHFDGDKDLTRLAIKTFNSYENSNYVLIRHNFRYQTIGRIESFEEAIKIDNELIEFLEDNLIPFSQYDYNEIFNLKIISNGELQ